MEPTNGVETGHVVSCFGTFAIFAILACELFGVAGIILAIFAYAFSPGHK